MTEEELLNKIAAIDIELHNAALSVANAKRMHMHAETKFIEAKLTKERLTEELRALKLASVDEELTYREKDIARFKEALPDILKNDKWNK